MYNTLSNSRGVLIYHPRISLNKVSHSIGFIHWRQTPHNKLKNISQQKNSRTFGNVLVTMHSVISVHSIVTNLISFYFFIVFFFFSHHCILYKGTSNNELIQDWNFSFHSIILFYLSLGFFPYRCMFISYLHFLSSIQLHP